MVRIPPRNHPIIDAGLLGNPRRQIDPTALVELADSIAPPRGVVVPLIVRPAPDSGNNGAHYQIIAGERRFRACAILVERQIITPDFQVPVDVRAADDAEALEIALLENLQREDMSAIDEGEAFKDWREADPDLTSSDIAKRIGKTPRFVQGRINLADKLCQTAKNQVRAGRLRTAQAEALIQTDPDHQLALLPRITKGELVTEAQIRAEIERASRREPEGPPLPFEDAPAGSGAASPPPAPPTTTPEEPEETPAPPAAGTAPTDSGDPPPICRRERDALAADDTAAFLFCLWVPAREPGIQVFARAEARLAATAECFHPEGAAGLERDCPGQWTEIRHYLARHGRGPATHPAVHWNLALNPFDHLAGDPLLLPLVVTGKVVDTGPFPDGLDLHDPASKKTATYIRKA